MRRFIVYSLFVLVLVFPTAAPALAAACDNEYLPATKIHSWTFSVTSKATAKATAPSEQYTVSVEKPTASGFLLQFTYPNVSLTWAFTCTGNGLASPQFGFGTGPSGKATFEVASSSGIVIPKADKWKVGSSWTSSSQGTATAPNGQKYQYKSTLNFQVQGTEQVKVPAGSFNTVKVLLTQTGEFGSGGYVQPLNYKITQWYAPGTGLVRQEDQAGIHELVAYKK